MHRRSRPNPATEGQAVTDQKPITWTTTEQREIRYESRLCVQTRRTEPNWTAEWSTRNATEADLLAAGYVRREEEHTLAETEATLASVRDDLREAESDRDSWKQRAEEAEARAEELIHERDSARQGMKVWENMSREFEQWAIGALDLNPKNWPGTVRVYPMLTDRLNEAASLRSELARVTEDRHKYLNRAAFAENELDRLVNGMGETFDELRKARRRVTELNTEADNIHADRVRLADSLCEARSELARVAKVVDAAKRARNVRHPNLSHYGTRKVPGMPADLTIYDSGYDVRANELDLALWGAIDALASHDTGGGG